MQKNTTTRRHFLKRTGAATAAAAFPTIIPASALGKNGTVAPSERIVMGGIGLGRRGSGDLGSFLGQKGVQYVAVCEVRKSTLGKAKSRVDSHYKNKDCTSYNDYRDLLAREDIDAVHIATPDHWHANQIIEACWSPPSGRDLCNWQPGGGLKILSNRQLRTACRMHYTSLL
jgi:hypothetical protein